MLSIKIFIANCFGVSLYQFVSYHRPTCLYGFDLKNYFSRDEHQRALTVLCRLYLTYVCTFKWKMFKTLTSFLFCVKRVNYFILFVEFRTLFSHGHLSISYKGCQDIFPHNRYSIFLSFLLDGSHFSPENIIVYLYTVCLI